LWCISWGVPASCQATGLLQRPSEVATGVHRAGRPPDAPTKPSGDEGHRRGPGGNGSRRAGGETWCGRGRAVVVRRVCGIEGPRLILSFREGVGNGHAGRASQRGAGGVVRQGGALKDAANPRRRAGWCGWHAELKFRMEVSWRRAASEMREHGGGAAKGEGRGWGRRRNCSSASNPELRGCRGGGGRPGRRLTRGAIFGRMPPCRGGLPVPSAFC
jgi:hypothetical protein